MKRFLGGFCEKEKGSKVDRGPPKNYFSCNKTAVKEAWEEAWKVCCLLSILCSRIHSYIDWNWKGQLLTIFLLYIEEPSRIIVEAKLAKPKLSRDHRREITFDSSRHQNQTLPLAFLKLTCKPFLEGEYLPNGWIWATRWEVWDILRCLLLATKVYISIQSFQLSNFP